MMGHRHRLELTAHAAAMAASGSCSGGSLGGSPSSSGLYTAANSFLHEPRGDSRFDDDDSLRDGGDDFFSGKPASNRGIRFTCKKEKPSNSWGDYPDDIAFEMDLEGVITQCQIDCNFVSTRRTRICHSRYITLR